MLCAQDDVVGSGYITAVTLQQKFNYTGKAYVLGTPSLGAELNQVGITAVGTGVSADWHWSKLLSQTLVSGG